MEAQEDRNINDILARYDDGEPGSVPLDLVDILPEDEDPKVFFQIRLAQARLRMDSMDIATALNDLGELLNDSADVYGENSDITRAVREALGEAHYMAAWVLHGVGAPQKEWMPFAERARQIFRYLAEHKDTDAYLDYESEIEKALVNVSKSKKRR